MMRRWLRTALWATTGADGLTATLAAMVLTLSACTSADSDVSAVRPPTANAAAPFAGTPFYVEFRTRPYFTITHTFVAYGAQDPNGHPLEVKTIGFFPHGGALGPFIGMVGIAGIVGDEDYYANLPSSTTMHRNLTAEQYRQLTKYVDDERAQPQIYNLFFNNCNDFVAGAANAVGLRVPFFHAMPPPLFIQLLAEMNE
jgi:hypothetical protein